MANDLAGNSTLGTMTPIDLWAGEAPLVTGHRTLATGVTLVKYEVFAVNSSGEAIKHDPTATAGTAPTIAVGFAAQPATAGISTPVFEAGAPNHAALVWHASLTTFAQRRAQFDRTPVHISKLV